MQLYFHSSHAEMESILETGFRDATSQYGTGVFLSSVRPVPEGETVLMVDIPAEVARQHERPDYPGDYVVPASVVNAFPVERDEGGLRLGTST